MVADVGCGCCGNDDADSVDVVPLERFTSGIAAVMLWYLECATALFIQREPVQLWTYERIGIQVVIITIVVGC